VAGYTMGKPGDRLYSEDGLRLGRKCEGGFKGRCDAVGGEKGEEGGWIRWVEV
jgi:hypothetical protein